MTVIPKFASSVILLRTCENREDKSDFEVLMIKRSENQRFLGGYHAFPGGKLEDTDFSEIILERCKGISKDHAFKILKDSRTSFANRNVALGFWVAAIRELFEEIGVLFAYKENKLIDLTKDENNKKFQDLREKMINNVVSIYEILNKEDLFFATDQLHYFRHFITPPIVPRRYDTRFFLALLPFRQKIIPFKKEITDFEWMSPREALKKYRKKEIKIIAPQFACLKSLMKAKSVCNLIKI
ncbi:MAG: NUDIX hydrolase [Candidatus Helarchaeota archaeon]